MLKSLLKSGTALTVVIGCLSFTPSAIQAAPITATWTSGNSDDWDSGVLTNPTNWNFSSAPTTASFPNNDVNDTFSVQIDNNGVGDSTVNLNTSVTIDSLNVSTDDTLNFNTGRDITLANGTLVNNGAINMNSTGASTDLTFSVGGSISGTGTLTMSNSNQNRIFINGASLTNGLGHTIQGAGQIGLNAGGIVNNGSIIQQGTTQLIIDPDAVGNFVNNNVLRAEGSGGLRLHGADYTNNSTIEAANGSHVTFNDANVRIIGGNLTSTGTGEIRANVTTTGAQLDGVTITAGSQFIQSTSADVRINNGITNEGTWELNSSGGSTDINLVGTQTIDGAGTIKMTDNFQNRIFTNGASDIITNAATHTIRGSGQLLTGAGGFINNGTLLQEGATGLFINPGNAANFVNNATIQATGTGGISLNDGTYTNNTTIGVAIGSNLTITSANTTIIGGDLTTSGTGEIRTTVSTTGAILDNVRLTSGSNLVSNSSHDWRIRNGFVNDGTVSMNSTGGSTDLAFIGSQTISGNGEIVWSDNNQNRILASDGSASTAVLTLGANQVLRGAGQIGANSGGFINNGTIRQQGNIALALDPGTQGFVNNNVLRAEESGGITFNAGTYTNNTTFEALDGSHLTFISSLATVVGGDLTTTGTGEIRTNQSSTGALLDNVRLTAGSNIVSSTGHDWRFQNGFVNDGTISLNSTGASTDLVFVGTQTLSGSGSIVMSDHNQNRIRNNNGADTLSIGSGINISGAGQIGVNTGGTENFGTINANQAINSILIDGGALKFTNRGTLRASGTAGIDINASSDQFEQAAGLVDVQAASRLDVTAGNYIQTGGQTTVNGIMATAGFNSTIELQGGRFGGSGTVQFSGSGTHNFNNTGGTLAAGNSPGILTISDGDYIQGAAASFEFELFGAVVGVGHDLLNILNGDADLSGSLDVVADQSFASTLNVGDQFEVVRLESGHSFLSGFFDTLTTNFTGLAFSQLFIGDSLWIEVTQADVPAPGVSEPGAMLVFAAGLGTLFVTRRRRRRTLH